MNIEKLDKTFYEVTGRRLDNTSQLKMFNILSDNSNKEKFLNIFKSYELNENILKNTFFDLYEVDNSDWWENISYNFYGTAYLWWVVAITNNITNPFEELDVGESVYILKPEYIYQVLKEIRTLGLL